MVEVEIKRLTDCNGNKTPTASISFDFPVLPGEHSILINEIMFDPLEGNSPYIELLNTSAEFINLYDLALRISGSDGEEGKVVLLCGSSRLLAPGVCIALCPDALNLRDEWNLGWEIQVLEVQDWKALSTSGGCVRLVDRSGNLIDGFCYNDSLHNDLIADPKGIALERACHGSYECWTSAAFSAGNGTPGQKNSQYFDPIVSEKQVSIHPRVFSPDGDGIDDLLFIEISGITVETAMEILVTDLPGNIVQNLAALSVGGETNVFCWDGRDNYGKMSYPGIYTIHIRIVSKQENMVFREICAVRYR